MLQVTIPVHPLTRGVLLTEYGPEPITADNHDALFDHLAGHVRRSSGRSDKQLSATITFAVDDDLAAHIQAHATAIGARLFRFHKLHLCLYGAAAGRVRGRGHVRPALAEWLRLYEVEEDHYSLDNAFKLFQRYGKKIAEKNPNYPRRLRAKSDEFLARKKATRAKLCAPVEPLRWTFGEAQAEMAAARFLAAVRALMGRWPRRVEAQARTYIYMKMLGLSEYETARKMGVSRWAVNRARHTILHRARLNPAIARLLQESLALPHPA